MASQTARAIKWWTDLAGRVPAPAAPRRAFAVSTRRLRVLSVVAAAAGLALGAYLFLY